MAEMLRLWQEMDREEKIGGLLFTVAVVAAIFIFFAMSAAF